MSVRFGAFAGDVYVQQRKRTDRNYVVALDPMDYVLMARNLTVAWPYDAVWERIHGTGVDSVLPASSLQAARSESKQDGLSS